MEREICLAFDDTSVYPMPFQRAEFVGTPAAEWTEVQEEWRDTMNATFAELVLSEEEIVQQKEKLEEDRRRQAAQELVRSHAHLLSDVSVILVW